MWAGVLRQQLLGVGPGRIRVGVVVRPQQVVDVDADLRRERQEPERHDVVLEREVHVVPEELGRQP